MKVLNISQSDKIIGGSDIYFRNLTSLLRENGVEVSEFYSSDQSLRYPREAKFESPSLRDIINFVYNREAKSKIKDFIFDLSVAHLHIYYGKLSSSILAPLVKAEIPIVQTLHEYKVVCPAYTMYRDGNVCYDCAGGKYYNSFVNACNRGSYARSLLSSLEQYVARANGSVEHIDKFIAVSYFQKKLLVQMGLDESKVSVVHNFVDAKGLLPEKFRGEYFLYFGRIEEVKGIFVLLKSLRYLKTRYGIDLPFVFAGAGSFESIAVNYCEENDLHDVQFLGFCDRDRVLALLGGCIATVVPSVWPETFGLTVVESLAAERACIVSNIGGMPEIIRDEVDGYIVEPGDELELADKLRYLYANLGVAERMGVTGRIGVMEKFTPSVHFEKIKEVYSQVLR